MPQVSGDSLAWPRCSDGLIKFASRQVAQQLAANEDKIVQELIDAQGKPVDIGGYYLPNDDMTAKAMRPSATLNAIIDGI